MCIGILIVLSSCASYETYTLPDNTAQSFSVEGEQSIDPHWWMAFNDADLNRHIDSALDNNFSLGAAWARLQAAEALARREESDLYPQLDLEGAAGRIIEDGDTRNNFAAGPVASYEVDLWGRIRAGAEAEDLRAAATDAAYRTAALTLSADIALTWVQMIEARQQERLLASQIATNKKVLDVLRARFGIGQIRSEDILRQELLIESAREELIQVEAIYQTLAHRLAVLKGREPQGVKFDVPSSLPKLEPLPQTGVPSDLVRRRPDTRQALYNIATADRELAVAVRDQYPSLSLSASYLSESASAGQLFTDWITTLAAGIVAPVFDGGARRAEVNRTEAVRDEQIQQYAQTMLEAFQEVEDALVLEDRQRDRIANLQKRLRLARQTVDQIRTGYFNGANEFVAVLNAQIELQGIERDIVQARTDLVEYRIALYRALAGGFETSRDRGKEG